MEISRRHLQDIERAELAELLDRPIPGAENQERAAELQAQVDGMTRNQRRVLNKRMAKAARKGK